MVATIILARLLTTAEFGIIALSQSLVGAASLISLAGIAAAIVTHKGDVNAKASTYFWLAAALGTVLAATLGLIAVPIVRFLGQPGSAGYVAVIALTLPLSLMTLVPQALLQRRLQYSSMNAVSVIGSMSYFVAEVALAFLGWGAWAVVWGQIIGAVASLGAGLFLAKWVPRSRPRLQGVREDVGLVANMGVSAFFTYLVKNVDYWVVSRFFGPTVLGVYYIAYVLPSIIRLRLSLIFRQVMLPLIASISSTEEQCQAWARAQRANLALSLPVMGGIAAVADPLVVVLFGAKWAEAAGPLRYIALAGLVDLVVQAVSTMAVARRELVGRTTLLVGLRALLVGGGAAAAAALWGTLESVAAVVLIASLVTLLIQEISVSRVLGVGFRVLGGEVVRLLLVCAAMVGAVLFALVTVFAEMDAWWQLILSVILGVILYSLLGWFVARAGFKQSVEQLGKLLRGA